MKSLSECACPKCAVALENDETTVAVDFGSGTFVVRDVPTKHCPRCGEEWIVDDAAEQLKRLTGKVRFKHGIAQVIRFSWGFARRV